MPQPVPGDDLTMPGLPANSTALAGVVALARSGDHFAFEILYSHFKTPIWNRLIHLVSNKEDAEELLQETFLRAWRNLPKMREDSQFGPWLYRIAANIAIDHLRHIKKLEFFPLAEEESEACSMVAYLNVKGPEELVCEKDYFEQAFAQVSPKSRVCLLLQEHWGFSQQEIAGSLEITVSCVSSYICRGREQFRQAYHHLSNVQGATKKGEGQ